MYCKTLTEIWSPDGDSSETAENKPGNFTSENAPSSPCDASLHQTEDELQNENSTAVHESLSEGERPLCHHCRFQGVLFQKLMQPGNA